MKLSIPLLSYLLYHPLTTAASQVTPQYHDQHQQPTRPKAHQLTSQYSFEEYIIDFQKSYSFPVTSEEYVIKKRTFETNLQTILKHNENVMYDLETGEPNDNPSGHSYHMGLNHLVDLTQEELKSSFYGYDKSRHEAYAPPSTSTATSRRNLSSSYEKDLPFNITDVSTLPKSYNLEKKTPVKNQGGCGSCWAVASATALEGHLALRTGKLDVLSPQELVSCVKDPNHCGGKGGCSGATAELAYEYVAINGMLKEKSFPYKARDDVTCPLDNSGDNDGNMLDIPSFKTYLRQKDFNQKRKHDTIKENEKKVDVSTAVVAKVQGYAKLPSNNYTALMNAVAKQGPVVLAAAAGNWGFYEGGVMSPKKGGLDIDHAVVLEGYGTDEVSGEDYWLVRNSWSNNWGESGYIRLKRVDPDTLDDPESDCGYDETPLNGVACELNPDGSKAVIKPVKVCGTSGILFDSVIPVGGHYI